MPRRDLTYLALTAVLSGGCTGLPAPGGWLPTAEENQTSAFGGWVEVWTTTRGKLAGELLAVSEDTIYLNDRDGVVAFPTRNVRRARVTGYDPRAGDLQRAVLLGTLSTLSHGLVSILSAPAWLLIGLPVAHSAVTGAQVDVSPAQPATPRVRGAPPAPEASHDWQRLRPWARFPQGMPEGLDRTGLRIKP